jgi:hypothetical protein
MLYVVLQDLEEDMPIRQVVGVYSSQQKAEQAIKTMARPPLLLPEEFLIATVSGLDLVKINSGR